MCGDGWCGWSYFVLLVNALESHSIASSRPSPLMAEVLNIWKVLFFNTSRPSSRWTSATDNAFSISCLFASTTKIALFNSSSLLRKITIVRGAKLQSGKMWQTYLKHRYEFLLGNANTFSITTIDHINDGVSVGVVTSPIWPDWGLPAQIPHLKLQILICNLLHVETNC